MWVWGEVGGVGFDHDAVQRREFRGFAEVGCVFVRDDACEGDRCAKVEDFSHVAGVACEAVEDELGWVERGSLQDWNEIVEGFAAVNDDGLNV